MPHSVPAGGRCARPRFSREGRSLGSGLISYLSWCSCATPDRAGGESRRPPCRWLRGQPGCWLSASLRSLPSFTPAPPQRYGKAPSSPARSSTQRPVPRSRGRSVVLTNLETGWQQVGVSDDGCIYEVSGLTEATYEIRASAIGFVERRRYGQRFALDPGAVVDLAAGDFVEAADFALRRGGTISGIIVDAAGNPMQFAEVEALRPQLQGEQRILLPFSVAQTNADGSYRLTGLPPWSYYVGAFDPASDAMVNSLGEPILAPHVLPGHDSRGGGRTPACRPQRLGHRRRLPDPTNPGAPGRGSTARPGHRRPAFRRRDAQPGVSTRREPWSELDGTSSSGRAIRVRPGPARELPHPRTSKRLLRSRAAVWDVSGDRRIERPDQSHALPQSGNSTRGSA